MKFGPQDFFTAEKSICLQRFARKNEDSIKSEEVVRFQSCDSFDRTRIIGSKARITITEQF